MPRTVLSLIKNDNRGSVQKRFYRRAAGPDRRRLLQVREILDRVLIDK